MCMVRCNILLLLACWLYFCWMGKQPLQIHCFFYFTASQPFGDTRNRRIRVFIYNLIVFPADFGLTSSIHKVSLYKIDLKIVSNRSWAAMLNLMQIYWNAFPFEKNHIQYIPFSHLGCLDSQIISKFMLYPWVDFS